MPRSPSSIAGSVPSLSTSASRSPATSACDLLVREIRRGRAIPGIGDVLLDIALRNKPPEALITYLSDHPKQALQHSFAREDGTEEDSAAG